MFKKSLFLITPIILTFATTAFSNVYCPPQDAVHCTEGICTVDSPYSNNWRLFVTGQPNGSPDFIGVSIEKSPGIAICQYGYTSSKRFLTLNSLSNYSPSFEAPGSRWMKCNPDRHDCYNCAEDSRACPMH
jgi:hypothetical protein